MALLIKLMQDSVVRDSHSKYNLKPNKVSENELKVEIIDNRMCQCNGLWENYLVAVFGGVKRNQE